MTDRQFQRIDYSNKYTSISKTANLTQKFSKMSLLFRFLPVLVNSYWSSPRPHPFFCHLLLDSVQLDLHMSSGREKEPAPPVRQRNCQGFHTYGTNFSSQPVSQRTHTDSVQLGTEPYSLLPPPPPPPPLLLLNTRFYYHYHHHECSTQWSVPFLPFHLFTLPLWYTNKKAEQQRLYTVGGELFFITIHKICQARKSNFYRKQWKTLLSKYLVNICFSLFWMWRKWKCI